MKIPALSWHDTWTGYHVVFFATKKERVPYLDMLKQRQREEKTEHGDNVIMFIKVFEIEVKPTKRGIVEALNERY